MIIYAMIHIMYVYGYIFKLEYVRLIIFVLTDGLTKCVYIKDFITANNCVTEQTIQVFFIYYLLLFSRAARRSRT